MTMVESESTIEDVLVVERRGSARWFWLNRPQRRNALNDQLIAALDAAVAEAERDPEAKVMVFAGRGKSFCAGADLRHLLSLSDSGVHPITFLEQVSALFTRIERSPLAAVALLHGHAIAGGLELALACDVVVAAEDTLVGDGHIRNNLVPAGGSSVRLARKVGDAMARRLMLTGEAVPAGTLTRRGWPYAVVPHGELHGVGETEVQLLAAHSGPGQAGMKQLLADLHEVPSQAALSAELQAFREHWDDEPVADALRDFLNAPKQTG